MLLVIPISLCVAMNQALAALPCHRRILLSGTPMQVSAKFHCSLMSIALKILLLTVRFSFAVE